jgi:hypothetical protein
MPNSFFTILQDYLRCCSDRCYSNTNTNTNDSGGSGGGGGGGGGGIVRDYSFDDLSSTTPKTPISWSSSSSLEDYKVAYKRPSIKPYIGIIPTNYYSD